MRRDAPIAAGLKPALPAPRANHLALVRTPR